jgi:radical SAM/Cys-rich protein
VTLREAIPQAKLATLGNIRSVPPSNKKMRIFDATLDAHGLRLRRARPRVLQVNVGKLCNLTCMHCHVNAGPKRKEIMNRETVDRILAWQADARLPIVDITGGAPEMIPDFRHFIEQLREIDLEAEHGRDARATTTIIDRCNLTILLEPGFEDLPDFLAAHRVEIVASMPCYSAENVNAQRGEGVFDASIAALQRLNTIGYGIDPALPLHLVFNPNGAKLPPAQAELEADYKRELRANFGIEFNRLYTITNLPVSRFASWLKHNGKFEEYMDVLVEAFNPATIEGLMCRDTINVSWLGEVFDCDFNQMLKLPMGGAGRATRYLWDVDPAALENYSIATGDHCFGCTAGAGSSCGGAIEAAVADAR